jgi:hypothetical protein
MNTLRIGAIFLLIAVLATSIAAESKVRSAHDHLMTERLRLREKIDNLALTADVTLDVGESLFQKILAILVPVIDNVVANIVIPGGQGKNFAFNPIHFTEFKIGAIDITFAAPDKVRISLDQLSFAIPQTHFDVWVVIIFKATCAGDFWASMSGTSIAIEFDMSNVGGKLQFSNPQSSVTWGTLNINHQFHDFCNFIEKVLQVFIGNIDTLIRNVVEKILPAKIGPLVEAKLNAVFGNFKVSFVGQPVVNANGITLTVDLIPQGQLARFVRNPHELLPVGRRIGMVGRDLTLSIPAQSLDNLLLYDLPKLSANITLKANNSIIKDIFPAAYALCPSCPFAIEFKFLAAPTVTFVNDTLGLIVQNLILGVNFESSSKAIVPFVDLTLNTTVNVQQLQILNGSTIYFQLQVLGFSVGQYASAIGPIDVSLINTVVDIALSLVVPVFNKDFKGLSLGDLISDGEIVVVNNKLKLGFDINIQ